MNETANQPQNTQLSPIDEQAVQARIEKMRLEQNIGLGIIAGSAAGVMGAIVWAAITYFTGYQIGYMAIGVGFLVGLGVSIFGKGIDRVYGIAGALIALVSVVLGNFLASLGFLAKALEVGYLDVLVGFNYGMTFELMKETFAVMDILFYAIAVYAGYRYSFRRVSRQQLLEGTAAG